MAELPPVELVVHEYRLPSAVLPPLRCKVATSGVSPDGVPRTSFGPHLLAALCVPSEAYRLSKRHVAQLCSDLPGLRISLRMVAKLERITADLLEKPVADLAERVKTAAATSPEGGRAVARPGSGSS